MKYFVEPDDKLQIERRDNIDYPAHLHERVEIGYIKQGSVILTVDEREYHPSAGDIFVVFPNQIHSYRESNGIDAKMIIFSPAMIPEFNTLFSSKIPEDPIISNATREKEITELIFDINVENKNALRGLLLALTALLFEHIAFNDVNKYNISTIKNLLIYCSEHFTEGISISDAAESLYISRYHIAHLFKEKLDTSFSDYITGKRIEHACSLLSDNTLTVAEIAYHSGFNSLRSFNRNFLKHVGISPKEYRKNK